MSSLAVGRISFRMSLFIAFSSIIRFHRAEDLPDDEKTIGLLMKHLALMGKTAEEISRELFLDFSTLPCEIESDPNLQAEIMIRLMYLKSSHQFDIRETIHTFHSSDRAKYDVWKFNNGIAALGVENFMVAATQFLEDEAAGGEIEIVSVGSGDGTIEKEILAEYRARFHKDLPRIKLVDPDPKFDGIVDFKTVDHLVRKRPNVVGNCVAFIIWPLPPDVQDSGPYGMVDISPERYDIQAIRKLQPKAVFIVYECAGLSGSKALRHFLRDENLDRLSPGEFGIQNWMSRCDFEGKTIRGLDHYSITEIAHRKIWVEESGTYIMRMVKVTRKKIAGDRPLHDSADL